MAQAEAPGWEELHGAPASEVEEQTAQEEERWRAVAECRSLLSAVVDGASSRIALQEEDSCILLPLGRMN